MALNKATWELELNCQCPKCEEHVNLLDEVNFWDYRSLDICEYGTDRSRNVDVVCPLCGHDFVVDLEY